VGSRLARVGAAVAYSIKGAFSTGPTIAGCRAAADGKTITLKFNSTLMSQGGHDAIKVQPYYDGKGDARQARLGSKMGVLVNASLFCMQLGGASCRDDGTGRGFDTKYKDTDVWKTVDIAPGDSPAEVVVDLSRTNGTAFAIRYADNGDCCSEDMPTSKPCLPASCPVYGSVSALPASPFVAHIVDGKCKCVAPQMCDE
jgi:hypothetical protein